MYYTLVTALFALLVSMPSANAASTQVDAFLVAKPMSQRDIVYNTDCYRYDAEMGCNDKDVNVFISTDERESPPTSGSDSISIVQYIYQ